jgi:hypothetical protein
MSITGLYTFRINTVCPICQENYKEDDEMVLITTCKHVYHAACINEWFKQRLQCPTCRGPVLTDTIKQKIYTTCIYNRILRWFNYTMMEAAKDDLIEMLIHFNLNTITMRASDAHIVNRKELLTKMHRYIEELSEFYPPPEGQTLLNHHIIKHLNRDIYCYRPLTDIINRYPKTEEAPGVTIINDVIQFIRR